MLESPTNHYKEISGWMESTPKLGAYDGKENLIDDLITLDILGLLDDENELDEEDEDNE